MNKNKEQENRSYQPGDISWEQSIYLRYLTISLRNRQKASKSYLEAIGSSESMSKRVDNMTCPMTAEALAALDGIKLAQQLECQKLCIEGDADDIISVLKSRETNLSKIGHIVDEIKKLADSFQEVQILQVKRTGNNVAHSFAKEPIFVHDMRYWRDVAPDFVVPILLKDVPA
ncbi:hypothetical protein RJ640_008703 [Escallonia rubra]|uniref:RNase H type-1 domain-containing protein n=1 Tax=Escallonia rubra TaxID=112253 RepID=A0AA88RAN4_9ASTE|nr:hypothetical protein RJ640_008703 [Escallonia rubra]